MRCVCPIDAYRYEDGSIGFRESRHVHYAFKLACGQCIGCRLKRSKAWAVRCMHESQTAGESCFVTLTYDDAHLPSQNSLNYRDYQLFCKRLRKRCGKFRFFMCGEYGEQYSRPHFHACLFGINFPDKVLFRTLPSGSKIYTSAILESLWPFGYSSVGDVTFESAAYVARYVCKKVTGPDADSHYLRVDPTSGEVYSLTPEFARMSLKPGIGAEWFKRYGATDVFPHDRVVIAGREVSVPKFYDRLLEVQDPDLFESIALRRMKNAEKFVDDGTPARLRDLETCTKARLSFKKRGLQ